MNKNLSQLELVPSIGVDDKPTIDATVGERIEHQEFEEKLWDPDSPDVCIPAQPPIACYENPFGAIVIRQRSPDGYDEDPFITVRPENAPALIAAIKRLLP
jgi:hypothetical protein